MTRVYGLIGLDELKSLELLAIFPVPHDAVMYAKAQHAVYANVLIAYEDGDVHVLHPPEQERQPMTVQAGEPREEPGLKWYPVDEAVVSDLTTLIGNMGPNVVVASLVKALTRR